MPSAHSVKLRPLEREDLRYVHQLDNNASVMRYWFEEPYEAFVELSDLYDKHIHDQSERRFVVECDGEKAGLVELVEINHVHRRAEFQIIISPEYQGKGLATRAAKLAMDYGFTVLNLYKLYLIVDKENENIIPNDYAGNMGYLIFLQPVTSEKFERKPIYWILSEVAKRLGPDVYQKFTEGRTQEQWLQHLYAKMLAKDPALPSYDELKKMGIYKRKDPNGHFVAYKAFRDDPEANPLKTPSGKIEIYSSRLAEIARTWELEKDEVISPLPVYASTFEGWNSPERRTFPLQLFGFHYKSRTHSTYGNIDLLKAACRQEVWINPIDAQKRGIANGDMVRVFNHRGEVRLPAKVTPRILPGVSAMGQGAWHEANMSGDKIDHGGCVNTLTTLRPSPLAKGNPQHTNLVEIEKI